MVEDGTLANKDIKRTIYMNGLRQWEVADALGINEATLSRKLRHELSEEDRDKILKAIEDLAGGDRNE